MLVLEVDMHLLKWAVPKAEDGLRKLWDLETYVDVPYAFANIVGSRTGSNLIGIASDDIAPLEQKC